MGDGAGNVQRSSSGVPLLAGVWYLAVASQGADGAVTVSQTPLVTVTNSRFSFATSWEEHDSHGHRAEHSTRPRGSRGPARDGRLRRDPGGRGFAAGHRRPLQRQARSPAHPRGRPRPGAGRGCGREPARQRRRGRVELPGGDHPQRHHENPPRHRRFPQPAARPDMERARPGYDRLQLAGQGAELRACSRAVRRDPLPRRRSDRRRLGRRLHPDRPRRPAVRTVRSTVAGR